MDSNDDCNNTLTITTYRSKVIKLNSSMQSKSFTFS